MRWPLSPHFNDDSTGRTLHQNSDGVVNCSPRVICPSTFLYHHFLAVSPDHIHSQPPSAWGIMFVLIAYLLVITEAIGTCVGVHFLWIAKENSNKAVKA